MQSATLKPRYPPNFACSGLKLLLLFLITCFAAHLRINACLQTEVQFPLRADAGDYFSYAYNLSHYGVYSREPWFAASSHKDAATTPPPDAVRSPGYPLFLIPFSSKQPSDQTILNVTLTQSFLGILTVPLCFLLARQLLAGYWAFLPSVLVAISPQLTIANTYVLTESLFAFALLSMTCALIWHSRHPTQATVALVAGAMIGVASLIRPTTQYFLPFYLLCVLPCWPLGQRLRPALLLIAGFAVMYAPWVIRNVISLGVLSDSTLTINTLVHGHYPGFMFEGRPETYGFPYRFDPRAPQLSQSVSAILAEISNNIRSDLLTQLKWYLIEKPIALMSWGDPQAGNSIFTYPVIRTPYLSQPLFQISLYGMRLTHPVWMTLALLGALVACLPHQVDHRSNAGPSGTRTLALIVFYFVLVHIAGFPLSRYAVPLFPVLYVLATFFIASAVKLSACAMKGGPPPA